jgi:hypothetical protein
MEDDKYIKELRESAIRKKLPTAEDFDLTYESPFKGDLPKSKEIKEEPKQEAKPEKETQEKTLLEKVEELYKEGNSLDEIYHVLSEQGYSYDSIEDAILKVTKKENKELEEEVPREEKKIEEIEEIEKKLEGPVEVEKMKRILSDKRLEYAPLFIKIEKYRETLETLENLENYLKGMSKLFDLINELEKIRRMNIEALTKLYHKVMETASKLYSGLIKPKGMRFEGSLVSESEIEKLDSVIKDLNKELVALREEIDKLKGL